MSKSETNSKSECRNSKQDRACCQVSNFEFRVCFGFRYSEFGFWRFVGSRFLRLVAPARRGAATGTAAAVLLPHRLVQADAADVGEGRQPGKHVGEFVS